MSAESWTIPGPDGERIKTNNFNEVREFLRQKKMEREETQKLLLTTKTPPPPRFAEPAHRVPYMRVSLR